jgi:reductive dehalogenase
MRLFFHRHRPVHLGPFPLECLARATVPAGAANGQLPGEPHAPGNTSVAPVLLEYAQLFMRLLDGQSAPARAPIPDDPTARANNLKAAAYFLDATMAATCDVPDAAWLTDDPPAHTHALVILLEFGHEPQAGGPGEAWIKGTQVARGDMRVAEVAAVLAGYLRHLGYRAHGHVVGATAVDIARLVVRAGLARVEHGVLVNPYVGQRFRAAVVTTDYVVAPDLPLASPRLTERWRSHGPGWWLGTAGTRPGWKRLLEAHRPLHLGPYPMECLQRVPEPTTLVLPTEIVRQPKRANFFTRALHGDLGEKAQLERQRFAVKHPYTAAMTPLMRAMVPLQGGEPAPCQVELPDPAANAAAIKALGYYLGADMVGICEAAPFAWYSHHDDGTPLTSYHRYAVVMLIDQGFETMEGASGDDWISGAQSMRAYMRGATIAGVMAAHLRRLGYAARSQTNADSDVLHIPLILLAGLGEMSRIGELVLNPFVGPRFKSVVLTTDLPLAVDRPIDFGLQDFCAQCNKCARECPCNAIPFGPKVMFNGYEIWKPDVEKCTKYRVTNMKGSACGRCMKTCPYNTEGLLVHRAFLWLAMHVPATRGWIARLDDRVGNGARNPIKKWWFDLELVDGVAVTPRGVNARDLNFGAVKRAQTQQLALYPPSMNPPPDLQDACPLDRTAALRAYSAAQRPGAAHS